MVIVRLMGGLGNQMFQYAAGRSLACRLQVPLKLDTSFFETIQKGNTPRLYELGCFNVAAEIAGADDVAGILGNKTLYKTLRAKIRKRFGLRFDPPRFYREPQYHYDEYFDSLPDNTYLLGYWHSERYFSGIADLLVGEFTCREPLAGTNLEIAEAIERTEAVAIHVRRGDYVTDHNTNHFHGVCGLEYYRLAVAEVARRIENPHFFVFSDDHEWVKAHLLFGFPTTFVDCNGPDKGCEDLRLMSLCRHNIIANSSFSWWGAWLNGNPDKTVIAPAIWFENADHDTRDLIPAGWTKL